MSENELKWSNLAENLDYVFKDNQIMFRAEYSKVLRKSKSGKTDIITTCGRPKPLTLQNGNIIYVNLTIYKYPEEKKEGIQM